MITTKLLNELQGFEAPEPSVVSLYLEMEGSTPPLASFLRLAAQAAAEEPVGAIEDDLKRIAELLALEAENTGEGRGLAVFSSRRLGLWRHCRLPLPVGARLLRERRPYLAPLLSMAEHYQRFGVALIGPDRARFLESFMGSIREYEEMTALPGGAALYHKVVAAKLGGLTRNQGFERVIVGTSLELREQLARPLRLLAPLEPVLTSELGPGTPAPAVLDWLLSYERETRRTQEMALVRRVLEAAGSCRTAVLGLERTLDALQKGMVRRLLVREGFAKLGRLCRGCGRLSLHDNKCLACGHPTEAIFNLVGEMIQRALDLKCGVLRLFHATPLDNLGKVAAELNAAVG